MKILSYAVEADIHEGLTIALVADLHDRPCDRVLDALKRDPPDLIAVAGDLTNVPLRESPIAVPFFREAVRIAPTFYAYGNHEMHREAGDDARVESLGVQLLHDRAVKFPEITIGGLTSGYVRGRRFPGEATPPPDLAWVSAFDKIEGYRVLLCHHPEYYPQYLCTTSIPLILAGHAHGGQIRLFGRGLYAPGQGLFPKYTKGVYDSRLIVSPGLANTGGIVPRLGNPTALLYVRLTPKTNNGGATCTTN